MTDQDPAIEAIAKHVHAARWAVNAKIGARLTDEDWAFARDVLRELEHLGVIVMPGVMHEVDRAFYDLVIKERDYERHRVERLERELAELRNENVQ